MNAAANTAGLPNPSIGAERLLDLARWLVGLLIIHWLTTCGRKLAAAFYKPWGPDAAFLAAHFGTTDRAQVLARITNALRRAADLQSELLARSPTEQGYPIELRRIIGARIIDIGQDLGFFRRAPISARRTTPRVRARNRTLRTLRTPRLRGASPIPFPAATGPPQRTPRPRSGRGRRIAPGDGAAGSTCAITATHPWSISGGRIRACLLD